MKKLEKKKLKKKKEKIIYNFNKYKDQKKSGL